MPRSKQAELHAVPAGALRLVIQPGGDKRDRAAMGGDGPDRQKVRAVAGLCDGQRDTVSRWTAR